MVAALVAITPCGTIDNPRHRRVSPDGCAPGRWHAASGKGARQIGMSDDAVAPQPLQFQVQSMRHPHRSLASRLGGCGSIRSCSRPITPIAPQHRPTRLGSRQRGPGPLADQLALLLRHGGVDPHHQVIGAGHIRRSYRVAILQQLRQRVGAAGDPIEPGRHQHRSQLSAAGERRLEARPVVVLAAGDVAVLGDQRPTLSGAKRTHAGLLRFQAEAG